MILALPEDDFGVPDLECAWCGRTVADADAETIRGRRLCRRNCAEEYCVSLDPDPEDTK